jgi:alanine racemase
LRRLEDLSAPTITLMTHFSDADTPVGVAEHLARFHALRREVDPTGRYPISIANSATVLRYPEAHGDWVRPGIMLYGSSPFPQDQDAATLGLKPVMTLSSELIAVRRLAVGDRVGYGGLFEAKQAMTIGVVACGYADGYPRHAPTGTPVLVAGMRTRTLGRVSMDKICVDLTGIAHATVGSPVLLWGDGLAADEVALAADTISYELFCALANRVPVVVLES